MGFKAVLCFHIGFNGSVTVSSLTIMLLCNISWQYTERSPESALSLFVVVDWAILINGSYGNTEKYQYT